MQDKLKAGMPNAEEHLGLVHHCASRFRGRGIEYEELYSTGCLGLVKAVHGFDPERGVQFSTYAVPVILGEMKRLFRDGGAIKVSRRMRENAMRLRRLEEAYLKKYGQEPTLSQLSELAGISESDAAQALCVTQAPLSLTMGDDEESSQLDIPVEAPDKAIGDLIALRQTMAHLSENDQKLLRLRYFQNLTQSKTAQLLGMTQVQVSRREKKLLQQMKTELLQ
ncbi:MAG: sigma-70 family RNA polymerase sigma factor [Oscillospiraceae bacterium]|nr:sigma-70 family RNA polymerase sigma factor [Oscillospiraceae bacterium]